MWLVPSLCACLPSCVPLVLGMRLRIPSPRSCVPLLPCRLSSVLPVRPVLLVGRRGDVGRFGRGGCDFFLWDFCAVGCFSFRTCAIMYAVAMGTSEWEAFVPRSHMPHLLTGGVVCFLLLSTRRPRSCSILVVPLFLIAPPFYTISGAISFCLLIITLCPPRACLPCFGFAADRFGRLRRRDVRSRRSHLPVRAPCGFS